MGGGALREKPVALFKNPFSSETSHEAKAKALWERAHKHFEERLFNRAITDLEDALTLNPGYAKEAYELMESLSSQGQDEQSVSVGTALLKVNPDDHELLNRLGNALRRLGDFNRAKNVYTQAVRANQTFAFARYNLAACSFGVTTADADLVKQTQAVESLSKLRRYDFCGTHAGCYPLGNQPSPRGEDGKAAEAGAPGQSVKPDSDRIQGVLAQEFESQPKSWEAAYNYGLILDLTGRPDEAIAKLKQACTLASHEAAPLNNLAVVLADHKKNLEAAETLLNRVLTHLPYERTVVLNLAIVSKRANKAFQVLKYCVYLGELLSRSLGEFDTDKLAAIAHDLFGRRKYVEAIPLFELLAKEHPNTELFEKLAAMHLSQKRQDQYLLALSRLVKFDPSNQEARHKISEAAKAYEDEAHKQVKTSKAQAAQSLQKAVLIEETAERWVELAQLYEDLGEEILAGNALKRWKEMTVRPSSAPPASHKAP
jgi:tetratricopeptide (TPR) repeat protein